MYYDKVLSNFKIAKQTGDSIQAYCPAHDDKTASLSILLNESKVLMFCHAGCDIKDILKNTGLTFSDLFVGDSPVDIYQYRTAKGELHHEKLKYQTPKGKTFTQRRVGNDEIVSNLEGMKAIPYNYPEVIKAIKEGSTILYVEGEKDANTGKLLGYVATTFGGASDWRDEYKQYFKNASIVQIPDKDDAGLKQAGKITDSLLGVTKSLRVLILPDGKDLTEWVEKGNSDLATLIKVSQDKVISNGIPVPEISSIASGYKFEWKPLNLEVRIDKLTHNSTASIRVIENDKTRYVSNINLLAPRSMVEISNRLKLIRKLDWAEILSVISIYCTDSIKAGEPVIELTGDSEDLAELEYLVYPIAPIGKPCVIFGDPGSGKSQTAIVLNIIASLPWHDNPLALRAPDKPKRGLYLDYEADKQDIDRQLSLFVKGMELGYCPLYYRRCSLPISDDIDAILRIIEEFTIDYVIIDSVSLAAGGDLNRMDIATDYMRSLRQLKTTSISLAHTSKDRENRNKTILGSVLFEAGARSVWEIRGNESEDYMDVALFHRKSNLSKRHKEIGFRINYNEGGNTIQRINPDSIPEFIERMSYNRQVLEKLKDGIMSTEELSVSTGIKQAIIRTSCARLKKQGQVSGDSKGWFLPYFEET